MMHEGVSLNSNENYGKGKEGLTHSLRVDLSAQKLRL